LLTGKWGRGQERRQGGEGDELAEGSRPGDERKRQKNGKRTLYYNFCVRWNAAERKPKVRRDKLWGGRSQVFRYVMQKHTVVMRVCKHNELFVRRRPPRCLRVSRGNHPLCLWDSHRKTHIPGMSLLASFSKASSCFFFCSTKLWWGLGWCAQHSFSKKSFTLGTWSGTRT